MTTAQLKVESIGNKSCVFRLSNYLNRPRPDPTRSDPRLVARMNMFHLVAGASTGNPSEFLGNLVVGKQETSYNSRRSRKRTCGSVEFGSSNLSDQSISLKNNFNNLDVQTQPTRPERRIQKVLPTPRCRTRDSAWGELDIRIVQSSITQSIINSCALSIWA